MAPHYVQVGSEHSISLSITWRSDWSFAEAASLAPLKEGINPFIIDPEYWPLFGPIDNQAPNDWIEIDHDASLDLKDSMTISFWINPTSDSGTFNRVVEKGLWGYNNSYYFGGGNGTNDLTFYLNGQEVIETPDNILTVGDWHHAAVSYTSNGDGTGTVSSSVTGNVWTESAVPVLTIWPASTSSWGRKAMPVA